MVWACENKTAKGPSQNNWQMMDSLIIWGSGRSRKKLNETIQKDLEFNDLFEELVIMV